MEELISKHQNISYLCNLCNQTRNLVLDQEVHLNRRMIKINGLAPYVDVHYNKEGRAKHGNRIFIDTNFDVRTIENIQKNKVETPVKLSAIPMPSMKKKIEKIEGNWESWKTLHLEILISDKEVVLISPETVSRPNSFEKQVDASSDLATVKCKSNVIINELTMDTLKFISEWLTSLCNVIESTSSLNIRMIPFIFKYIDTRVHRRITIDDTKFITSIIDSSAIIIPDKINLNNVIRFGKGIEFSNIQSEYLILIANHLLLSDKFYFFDEHTKLINIMTLANFSDLTLIFYIYHLYLIEAFTYRPSKLIEL